jgi:hypothetical protein
MLIEPLMGNGKIKTTVYREIVQMKQDRIVPIFRCQIIETIVLQYCGHQSSVGVTMYIRFREPRAVKACKVALSR